MGKLILLVGPSGSGKTSLLNQLIGDGLCKKAITCTTREPRPGEVNGRDYFFLTPSEFKAKRKNKEFLEVSKHFKTLYGTPKAELLNLLKTENVGMVVDVNGKTALCKNEQLRDKIISVFVYVTKDCAIKRLTRREEKQIKNRIKRYDYEVSKMPEYDFIIDNNSLLETTFQHLVDVIQNFGGK